MGTIFLGLTSSQEKKWMYAYIHSSKREQSLLLIIIHKLKKYYNRYVPAIFSGTQYI